ncbi:hypothetical protein F53441_14426 [Fusarium austroafricanum]|uniref:Uncharacterized protein n=1 Tax=Fusarium austroafricanum TaxID=2364996 RepID=A0A8H4NKD1_9HYPO|nr:hypothetical protein F53441_14426 [Fusarium austroafricanum]
MAVERTRRDLTTNRDAMDGFDMMRPYMQAAWNLNITHLESVYARNNEAEMEKGNAELALEELVRKEKDEAVRH